MDTANMCDALQRLYEWLSKIEAGDLATWAGAFVAFFAVYLPGRTQKSQEIMNQAVRSLERAYEILTDGGAHVDPPAPDKLNWLTAARHIVQYRTLKKRIALRVHLDVCEEHEEYWRNKIYASVSKPVGMDLAYYEGRPQPNQQDAIDVKSAIIVHEFAKWPKDRMDPIDTVDEITMITERKVHVGNRGLRSYLATFTRYRDLL